MIRRARARRWCVTRCCCFGTALSIVWVTMAGALCDPNPNIILILADDLDRTALPVYNPALQPGLLTPATIAATATDKARLFQSPTMNRLEARMCAERSVPANFGTCAGASDFGLGLHVEPGDKDPADPNHPYDPEECQSNTRPPAAYCDAAWDILPGFGGLNRIAQGAIFNRFYATAAVCAPTRASLLTGRPGPKTGANANSDDDQLPAHEVSLAEYLRQRCNDRCYTQDGECPFGPTFADVCYHTGIIGKWHGFQAAPGQEGFEEAITYLNPEWPYLTDHTPLDCHPAGLNLDLKSDGVSTADPALGTCLSTGAGWIYERSSTDQTGGGDEDNCWDMDGPARFAGGANNTGTGCPMSTRIFSDLAENFINRYAAEAQAQPPAERKPFFLIVAFNNVHEKPRAPRRTRQHYFRPRGNHQRVPRPPNRRGDRYWALHEEIDAAIGRIIDKLDGEGLLAETLILFTSDQGPETGGRQLVYGDPRLRGGKRQVSERGIRVPFLARACSDDHLVTGHVTSHVDLFRTIAEAAGMPVTALDNGHLCACDHPQDSLHPDDGQPCPCVSPFVQIPHDVDGTSFYRVLQQNVSQPPGVPLRNFQFAQAGIDRRAVSTREGYYVARSLPTGGGSTIPATGGVCGYIGPEPGDTTNKYAQVLVGSCTPCNPDGPAEQCDDVQDYVVLGSRCAPEFAGQKLWERARCKNSAQCSGVCQEVDVQDEDLETTYRGCVRAAWKWMEMDGQEELVDLATNPEEDDRLNCASSMNQEIAAIRSDLDTKLGQWQLGQLWDRCEACPSPNPPSFLACTECFTSP